MSHDKKSKRSWFPGRFSGSILSARCQRLYYPSALPSMFFQCLLDSKMVIMSHASATTSSEEQEDHFNLPFIRQENLSLKLSIWCLFQSSALALSARRLGKWVYCIFSLYNKMLYHKEGMVGTEPEESRFWRPHMPKNFPFSPTDHLR